MYNEQLIITHLIESVHCRPRNVRVLIYNCRPWNVLFVDVPVTNIKTYSVIQISSFYTGQIVII